MEDVEVVPEIVKYDLKALVKGVKFISCVVCYLEWGRVHGIIAVDGVEYYYAGIDCKQSN